MRIIDIESNRTEEILHTTVGSIHTIDKILTSTSYNNLENKDKKTAWCCENINWNKEQKNLSKSHLLYFCICMYVQTVQNNKTELVWHWKYLTKI